MHSTALTRDSGEILFSHVCRALRDDITRLCRPGDFLPAEQTLARRFAISRETVRHVIDELVAAGLLERRGKGAFVLDAGRDPAPGIEAGPARTRVIRRLVMPGRGEVASRLGLAEGEPVIWFETLQIADGRPFCLVSHFLRHEGLESVYETYAGGPLHPFVQDRFAAALRQVDEQTTARLPPNDDAVLLAMPHDLPLFRVKRVYVDDRSGRRLTYALIRYRADRLPPSMEI